jgi:hypothetical protein
MSFLKNNSWKQMAAWTAVPFIAVANGALRELTFGRVLPPTLSHNLSMVPLLIGIFAYAFYVGRRWPLEDVVAGTRVGLVWAVLTVAFELGLGALTGHSVREMAAQYNVFAGNLWPLAPLSMAIAPEVVRRFQQRRVNHQAPAR